MLETIVLGALVGGPICGILAALIASSRKADGCAWFFIGLLLGPIGVIATAIAARGEDCPGCRAPVRDGRYLCPRCVAARASAPPTKPCPACAEPILLAAIKCKHCGEFLPVPPAPQPIDELENLVAPPMFTLAQPESEGPSVATKVFLTLFALGVTLAAIYAAIWFGRPAGKP